MDRLVLIAIIVTVVVILLLLLVKKKRDAAYPYIKLDALFTPAERSFLGVLTQAVDNKYLIFGKVRVADVITPKDGLSRSIWQTAFNKISRKHFDYVLCDKEDLSVVCVIELNDSSHNAKNRKERDAFLERSCLSANLLLLQFTARARYNVAEIQNTLETALMNVSSPKASKKRIDADEKRCSRCSALMIKRVAKKGKNIGSEFWACSAFPQCRHTEAVY